MTTAQSPPALNIPNSTTTVAVRIIDTTCYGKAAASLVFTPNVAGLDNFVFPSYAFLVSHRKGSVVRHVLFDAGMRKDWEEALPPPTVDFIKQYMPFEIEKNVDEILDEDAGKLGISSKDIENVIWSHHHFDHRGDITKFPADTGIIWGPGSTAEYTPAYPTGPTSSMLQTELEARTVRELKGEEFNLQIGGFPAYDYFGDGSFYLLSSPGHTVGHLCALARVMPQSDKETPSFVFMGGDCTHYAAIFRPSQYLPLPETIPAAPNSRFGASPCPGALFAEHVLPHNDPTKPFLKANQGVNVDQPQAEKSIGSMQEFDASEDILVCIAHDASLLGQIPFYPERLNEWKKSGLKKEVAWRFCGDFER